MKRSIILLMLAVLTMACSQGNTENKTEVLRPNFQCNADSLLGFVKAQTDFGARVPNSQAHTACEEYLVSTFERYGCKVEQQKSDIIAHDGKVLHSNNIIASINPHAKIRIFIASHYDSRPWCSEEALKEDAEQPVMGANDGASGVAVMLEMARVIVPDSTDLGIDFICFDMEDYGVSEAEHSYCLGSQYWAKQTKTNGYKAAYGILLDMVGGPDAKFYREKVSDYFAKDIVSKVWNVAACYGIADMFIDKEGGAITDDHYYVNAIAGIPCIDIIDFTPERGFPDTWHTKRDVVDNISAQTLYDICNVLLLIVK